MPFRPNFRDTVRRSGDRMIVVGATEDAPPPDDIRVYLEQGDRVARGSVETLAATWQVSLPADGFSAGQALAFGVEIRTDPFHATAWSQLVTIE